MDDAPRVPTSLSRIIEQATLEQSKTLDLSSLALGGTLFEIPDEVFELSQLERISLFGNGIREVPERIRDLKNLTRLTLIDNPIEKVPDIPGLELDWESYEQCRKTLSDENVAGISIELKEKPSPPLFGGPDYLERLSGLRGLRSLRMYHSTDVAAKFVRPNVKLKKLIGNLDLFQNLESLSISGFLLHRLPIAIRKLRKLKSLGITGAGLRQVPAWVGELEFLQFLYLALNNLRSLPASLEALSRLETVALDDNPFIEIPDVIFRLPALANLAIDNWKSKGRINQIPDGILKLSKLQYLGTHNHPIEIPPPEIVKEGVDAIKNYWRQQQEAGVDYLCEAKLIILGEAGAGKTTLVKKIKDNQYELTPQEHSTEGIDVVHWSFPSAIRVKQDGHERLHNTEFKVSIWDFGGQEIYHATHQFFLTRRSLYALVADDRKEDTDFNYWLQVVELLSDRSPLLIVQNEKQDRQRDLDLGSLRADFSNLRESFRINLATNRGLDELIASIRQELEHLPHIGTPLPKTWSRVRTVLENDARNYISLDEYLAICRENGFAKRDDSLQLSGYLHDLGICLHFQDDPVLKNIVILKPKWGTDAVYRVLDDHAILDNRGRFGPSDLSRIWSDDEYAPMRDELLHLMMRFQLCYKLPSLTAYIAPQLASSTRPAYEWEALGGLVLRYDYDFMPKGILTRFIVALNHLIADQNLVWKSGVILEREGSRAEVTEDYVRRKITVRVSGADSRGLLAIVDDQLERIHATFPRLKYDKFLPCNCEVCQTRAEPSAYSLTELIDFAA